MIGADDKPQYRPYNCGQFERTLGNYIDNSEEMQIS